MFVNSSNWRLSEVLPRNFKWILDLSSSWTVCVWRSTNLSVFFLCFAFAYFMLSFTAFRWVFNILWNLLLSGLSDIRSCYRDFWAKIFSWRSCGAYIWYTWAEAFSRKLDSSLYYGNLASQVIFLVEKLKSDTQGLLLTVVLYIFSRLFHQSSMIIGYSSRLYAFHKNAIQDLARRFAPRSI